MIILVVGGRESCEKLKEVFKSLRYLNLRSNPTLTEGYIFTNKEQQADQLVVKYNPDIIFCDARFDDFSCVELKGYLRLAYKKPKDNVGPYANKPIVMIPGTASPVSFVEAEAMKYNIPFLDDPSDQVKVRALLTDLVRKKGD